MLNYLTLVFVCQLAGELLVTATGLALPGPVAGMVLLFAFLVVRNRMVARDREAAADAGTIPADLARVADALLGNLSLLFVPAGVGIVAHLALLRDDWLPLSAALVVSTVLTIVVTAGLMVAIGRLGSAVAASGEDKP